MRITPDAPGTRELEQARQDEQVQQWQQETRLVHIQLLAKQEELRPVYRDLEHLNGELGHHRHERHRLNQMPRSTEALGQVDREALKGEQALMADHSVQGADGAKSNQCWCR